MDENYIIQNILEGRGYMIIRWIKRLRRSFWGVFENGAIFFMSFLLLSSDFVLVISVK